MIFTDLWLMWILGPVYVLWALLWLRRHGRTAPFVLKKAPAHTAALRYSSVHRLKRLRPSTVLRMRGVVQGLRLLTVALLLLAMARPQTGRTHSKMRTEGIDIVLAVDTSGSMRALDLDAEKSIAQRRNRLQVVQHVMDAFIRKRPNDQIGLVVFGAEAFTQCPLTLDHKVLATFVDTLEIGMAGDSTAIGSAIATAVKRLKDSKAKSKVIILLTDGRNNAGALSPKKAAEVAQAFGIKLYTIGAGTRGKAPFVVDSMFGKQVHYEDVQIDEDVLRDVANITGGTYFRAEDTRALETIYERIDAMETTTIEMNAYAEYTDRFPWFVVPAVGLLLAEIVLLGTRFRKLP